MLPRSTYYRHQRWFFDAESQQWSTSVIPRGQISEEWMKELEDIESSEEAMEEAWNPDENDCIAANNAGENESNEADFNTLFAGVFMVKGYSHQK